MYEPKEGDVCKIVGTDTLATVGEIDIDNEYIYIETYEYGISVVVPRDLEKVEV